ncbi:MAG: hypothetical protein IKE89_03525 [Bacilli bacterium]|nr:hypothetical protein [Bacilli bacterium]MBR2711522.1 hypothetical protein [Bacilli bacterium]
MQEEIKEILDKLQKVANRETASRNALMEMKDKDYQLLLDYITNLQEENEYSNHCNEELRKKITNLEYKIERLEEDNKNLKELCDKYEEEHSTTFEEWKKNLKNNKNKINELKLNNYNKKLEIKRLNKQRDKFKNKYKYLSNSLKDYKSRNEKAIEYCNLYTRLSAKDLLDILQGVDKE